MKPLLCLLVICAATGCALGASEVIVGRADEATQSAILRDIETLEKFGESGVTIEQLEMIGAHQRVSEITKAQERMAKVVQLDREPDARQMRDTLKDNIAIRWMDSDCGPMVPTLTWTVRFCGLVAGADLMSIRMAPNVNTWACKKTEDGYIVWGIQRCGR